MEHRKVIGDTFATWGKTRAAWELIRDRRLWTGMHHYGWVQKVLLGVAMLLSFSFLGMVSGWMGEWFGSGTLRGFFSGVSHFSSKLFEEGYHSFTSGFMKYFLLLLVEVLIFHFMQRALQEVEGTPLRTDFQTFLNAELRMLQVVVRTWAMELVATVLVSIFFGLITPISFLKPLVTFVVQCYFFGLVIMDNYNEQFGLNIKQSLAYSQQFKGIAFGLGFILYLFMLIPVVGVIAGTILVSVTAVLVMEKPGDV
ncbi:MAG: EI24 domain-containing protein [Saprospiraceae bacterium]